MKTFFLPAYTLWKREIVRFYRQKSRVIGALVPPFLFWFLIGSGLRNSFQNQSTAGINYLQYFFPGTIVLVILFTAIFSTISIIEDRKEGFLQSVLIAPVPRSSIVLGKILGGTTLAFLQGCLFGIFALFLNVHFTWISFFLILMMMFGIAFGLTGLGFLIAWRMDSTQGFHSIMNLFLMPLWFLSGSLFPMEGTPSWLHWTMILNPLTYGIAGMKYGFYPATLTHASFPSLWLCFAVTFIFCIAMFILSSLACRYER